VTIEKLQERRRRRNQDEAQAVVAVVPVAAVEAAISNLMVIAKLTERTRYQWIRDQIEVLVLAVRSDPMQWRIVKMINLNHCIALVAVLDLVL